MIGSREEGGAKAWRAQPPTHRGLAAEGDCGGRAPVESRDVATSAASGPDEQTRSDVRSLTDEARAAGSSSSLHAESGGGGPGGQETGQGKEGSRRRQGPSRPGRWRAG